MSDKENLILAITGVWFECQSAECEECAYKDCGCFPARAADVLIKCGVELKEIPCNFNYEWIPILERVPTADDTAKDGSVVVRTEDYDHAVVLWSDIAESGTSTRFTHWMPLPRYPWEES